VGWKRGGITNKEKRGLCKIIVKWKKGKEDKRKRDMGTREGQPKKNRKGKTGKTNGKGGKNMGEKKKKKQWRKGKQEEGEKKVRGGRTRDKKWGGVDWG